MFNLPVEIENYIYEIAIKTYFYENIKNYIWYNSWLAWRKKMVKKIVYCGTINRINFAIDYFFYLYKISNKPSISNIPLENTFFPLHLNTYKHLYSDEIFLNANYDLQENGFKVYFLEKNRDCLFSCIIFTKTEYYSRFCNPGTVDEDEYIDIAENKKYRMCYITTNTQFIV